MDIYAILAGKPHNPHYLKRYTRFIEYCRSTPPDHYSESHHICPKAKDLFPEFSSFKLHPWNRIELSPRQHFIAHWLLWKCFGQSMAFGFHRMKGMTRFHKDRVWRLNSRSYESLRRDMAKVQSERMSGVNHWSKKTGVIHNSKTNHPRGMLGKHHSEETKAKWKISRTNDHFKGKNHSEETLSKLRTTQSQFMWISNGIETLRVRKDVSIPEGFHRGRS